MPLIIFLVECGLELIPKQIRKNPAVRRSVTSKNYSSQLLDNALHHSAMKNLKQFQKRGRPDITHVCMLNALGSALNKTGNLKLYIHTINNKIFEINPEIRIARNFNRFKGLTAKLLIDNKIQVNGSFLISPINGSLNDLIKKFKMPEIILLSSKGKLIKNHQDLFLKDISKNLIVIIGGFQKNNFSKNILDLTDKIISISSFHLDAWVVVAKTISYYEIVHDII